MLTPPTQQDKPIDLEALRLAAERELIELAAKAAGICLHPDDKLRRSYGNWGCDTTCIACKKDPSDARWNPLTDDGDALRLAVKLQMQVTMYVVCADASAYGKDNVREYGADPYAATRRAIVRAAAEIGRGMS